MKAYKIILRKIDWNTYYSIGYNYVEDTKVIYALSNNISKDVLKGYNNITVTEIEIIENN